MTFFVFHDIHSISVRMCTAMFRSTFEIIKYTHIYAHTRTYAHLHTHTHTHAHTHTQTNTHTYTHTHTHTHTHTGLHGLLYCSGGRGHSRDLFQRASPLKEILKSQLATKLCIERDCKTNISEFQDSMKKFSRAPTNLRHSQKSTLQSCSTVNLVADIFFEEIPPIVFIPLSAACIEAIVSIFPRFSSTTPRPANRVSQSLMYSTVWYHM